MINSVVYYSKVRFAVNLLPLLNDAPVLRRVICCFAGGLEGKVVTDDLDGRTSSQFAHRDNLASMVTLAMAKFSEDAPRVSWVHNFPGFVESGLWESMPGFLGTVVRTVVWALGRFFYMDPEECGQRQVFMATSARFPPASPNDDRGAPGVELIDDTAQAMSLNGDSGGGAYSITEHADPIPESKALLLRRYTTDGTKEAVWRHTMETFKRVTGKERL